MTKVVGIKHTCIYKDCPSIVVQALEPGKNIIEVKTYLCANHTPACEMRTEEIREEHGS